MHEYLVHGPRGEEFDKTHPELTPDHQAANIAGDYEISNKGYTDADKTIARGYFDKVIFRSNKRVKLHNGGTAYMIYAIHECRL